MKMAGSGSDHMLLVVGLDFVVEGATVEVFGVPLLGRGDGFLLYASRTGSSMTI